MRRRTSSGPSEQRRWCSCAAGMDAGVDDPSQAPPSRRHPRIRALSISFCSFQSFSHARTICVTHSHSRIHACRERISHAFGVWETVVRKAHRPEQQNSSTDKVHNSADVGGGLSSLEEASRYAHQTDLNGIRLRFCSIRPSPCFLIFCVLILCMPCGRARGSRILSDL